ncbi:hypothetical protein KMI_08g13780 [Encephalitozoon hellem]|nr:hypothetical protein KMI_08g13780 [Encephalitozoon hellem]
MADIDRAINIFDFSNTMHNILNQRDKLFGSSKTFLFTLFSCASVMIFQGENYKNLCLSVIVGLCMMAVDQKVHARLLGTAAEQKGMHSAIVSFLNKILVSEILFCSVCFLIAVTINMCMIPIAWIFAASVGVSFFKKTFTEDLTMVSMSNLLTHLGFLAMFAVSLGNPRKFRVVIYSVFFSFSGTVILWITLEAILNENLGFGRVCSIFFKGEIVDLLGIPVLYPFLLLMTIGVFTQVRINTLLFAYDRRRFTSIVIKKSENKVIEV